MKLTKAMAALLLAGLAMPATGASCSATSAGIVLGIYTPNQAAPADSVGRVSVTCEKSVLDALPLTVPYSVEISRGGGASYAAREMSSGTNSLRYNLYLDPSRTTIWGDATGGTSSAAGALQLQSPLGSSAATHSFYGRVFAGQNLVPGSYADAIVITVVY